MLLAVARCSLLFVGRRLPLLVACFCCGLLCGVVVVRCLLTVVADWCLLRVGAVCWLLFVVCYVLLVVC